MKKFLCLALVCAVAGLSSLARVQAADTKPVPAEKPKKETKDKPLPYRGKLTAVDKSAKTITIGDRVFHVTSETKITKDDKPAVLEDGKAGDEVRGQYKSAEGDKLQAVSIYYGVKAPAKPKEKKPEAK